MSYYFPHFSILLVILIAAFLYERQIRYNKIMDIYEGTPYYYRSPLMPWLLVFGYLAILSGYRSAMNDTTTYIDFFKSTEASWDSFIKMFSKDIKYVGTDAFQVLFKMFVSENYHMWFLTWAVIESCLFVNVLRRESVSFLDACFFFFASTLYYNYFSMMRQWMAVAISFWGARYLRDDKMIKYFFTCAVAALFHTSALVMIPIYFMVRGKPWQWKQLLIIAGFAASLAALNPILSALEASAEGTVYDYAIERMNTNTGSSIVRGVITAVPVILAFFARNEIDDPMINVCVNMSLVNMMLNILASFTSGLYVIRLSTYLAVYNAILYPYLLNVVLEKNKQLIKLGFYVLYLAYFIYQNNHGGTWGYRSDVLTWLSNY